MVIDHDAMEQMKAEGETPQSAAAAADAAHDPAVATVPDDSDCPESTATQAAATTSPRADGPTPDPAGQGSEQDGATGVAAPEANPIPADLPPDVARLLKLRVPAIVTLGRTKLPIWRILRLSPGSVIELDRSGSAELDLMINNRVIGTGRAAAVGEHFALRVTHVGAMEQRIRSMGAPEPDG